MGILYIVGTPIGNLKDMTERALEVLQSVSLIACEDTRTSGVLLKHFNINKKLVSYHKFNEKEKSAFLIEKLKNGDNIALITDAGCPCISDPGYILTCQAIKNNIEVIAIPGASAVITSLMCSGMDTSSFTFYGFLNREKKKMQEELEKLQQDSSNLIVIYESPKRIKKTLMVIDEIMDNPYICLANDLTKKFEKKYYGTVHEVLEKLNNNSQSELGEYVLIIEKKQKEKQNNENKISCEALIIDVMIKSNCAMKEAIKIVSEEYHFPKNMVYDASLSIKKMFE